MFAAPEVLNELAHHRALRMPEHQPAARVLLDGEQVQRLPQRAVVPAARFLLFQAVCLQLLLSQPGSAIDSL
jgi:hypothetical protein